MSVPDPADHPTPGAQDVEELLCRGEIVVRGRMVDASNATLFASVRADGVDVACVYKPVAGERPLWDFPGHTLARREVAAYLLSVATGWGVVPPTVMRLDGPFGPGSVQCWVGNGGLDEDGAPVLDEPGAGLIDLVDPADVPPGWLHVLRARSYEGSPVSLIHADDPALRRMSVFDVVVNNADRKGGHVLRGVDGGVLGVDHGLTFNIEDKLRTVLWGWAGQPLPPDVVDVLQQLAADLRGSGRLHRGLGALLSPAEIRRTTARVEHLLQARRHPRPGGSRHPIPWPAF